MTHGKSVVVPVEPTEAMLDAFALQWHREDFPTETPDQATPAYIAGCKATMRSCWSAMLAAAPAPSSLAGGEKLEAIARIVDPRAWKTRDGQYAEIERSTAVKDKDDARRNADSYIRKSLRLAEKIDALSDLDALLKGRDDFIVSKGLWGEFVSTLPAALAALSPEAPAREVSDATRFRAMVEEKLQVATRADHADALFPMGPEEAALYHRTRADLLGWVLDMLPSDTPALTPRHEAPASRGLKPGDQIEFRAHPTEPGREIARIIRHEAPAEGAGELIQRIVRNSGGFAPEGEDLRLCVEALDAALRAHTSAPEAREDAPFMFAYEDVDKPGEWRAFRHQIKRADGLICPGRALYTRPAAPSADKLRMAGKELTEALERYGFPVSGGAKPSLTDRGSNEAVALDEAARAFLSTLKAEGA